MRVLLVKTFRRFQRRERLADAALVDAVARAERGLVDADLGGGLIKQCVARTGGGKSGGYRTIIAYRQGRRAVFLLGFPKNEQANIDDRELADLRKAGVAWLAMENLALDGLIVEEKLWELDYDDEA